jgi:glycosyltransferase involved in cell wall biosynthesis
MNDFLISIITPTFNSASFLEETIESIICQTYTNWELLITDDCSTDSTWLTLEDYVKKDSRVKIFKLANNSGSGVARNNSIRNASGRFIAFCDSDDQWKPNKLEKQIEFMISNDLDLSYSNYEIVSELGEKIGVIVSPHEVDYKKMLRNNYIGCLTAIYDTNRLGKVYMPEIRKRQDWALWLKILKKTPFAMNIQESLAVYRQRNKSISSNKIDLIKFNWHIYRNVEKFSAMKSILLLMNFFFFYLKKIYWLIW